MHACVFALQSGTAGFTPSGVELAAADARNWSDPVGDGAEVFAWRSGHWNNWCVSAQAALCSGS
eukprot:COSAG01_NODE_8363_length_2815_cov_1460.074006_1_plen_64_part_00